MGWRTRKVDMKDMNVNQRYWRMFFFGPEDGSYFDPKDQIMLLHCIDHIDSRDPASIPEAASNAAADADNPEVQAAEAARQAADLEILARLVARGGNPNPGTETNIIKSFIRNLAQWPRALDPLCLPEKWRRRIFAAESDASASDAASDADLSYKRLLNGRTTLQGRSTLFLEWTR
jgi:hypothetical protein